MQRLSRGSSLRCLSRSGVQAVRWRSETRGVEVVRMPKFGDEDGALVDVTQIYKQVGDTVKEDEPVLAVEDDKCSIDIDAPCDGIITKMYAKEDYECAVGDKLFEIEMTAGKMTESDSKAAQDTKSDESESDTAESVKPE
ncbi:MAG: hypothetical protein MHM6MM_001011 [Cercozoa sp. M6MM]